MTNLTERTRLVGDHFLAETERVHAEHKARIAAIERGHRRRMLLVVAVVVIALATPLLVALVVGLWR